VAITGNSFTFAGDNLGDLLPGKKQPISSSSALGADRRHVEKMGKPPFWPRRRALVKVDRALHFFGGAC